MLLEYPGVRTLPLRSYLHVSHYGKIVGRQMMTNQMIAQVGSGEADGSVFGFHGGSVGLQGYPSLALLCVCLSMCAVWWSSEESNSVVLSNSCEHWTNDGIPQRNRNMIPRPLF